MSILLKSCAVLALCLLGMSLAQAKESSTPWQTSYALEASGQYEQAAAVLVPLLGYGGSSEFALLRYGWLNYLQGNYNDSIRAYTRSLTRNTRSIDARLGIALPLLVQQRWREAAKYAQQVIAVSPWNYSAHESLMRCEEGLKQWETLAKHARDVSSYYPSVVAPYVYLARADLWLGQTDKAYAAYQQVLERQPNHLEALRYLKIGK
ncbi:MAG: tetratricopeptide repeat protein [Mariprofundaceae bacterium]|nr:tetratricopeptide repeat protein [Mariprofundaceae bacterium]